MFLPFRTSESVRNPVKVKIALSVTAIIFVVTCLFLSIVMFVIQDFTADSPRLTEQYKRISSPECKSFLRSANAVPVWRRNLLASTIIAIPVALSNLAVSLSLRELDAVMLLSRFSSILLITTVVSFVVMNIKSNFENWHLWCPGSCAI